MINTAIALVSLQTVKDTLDIKEATKDTLLELLIDSVSQRFNTKLRRVLAHTTYTDSLFDGSGNEWLYLPAYPISEITSVTEDDVLLVKETDYKIYYMAGALRKALGALWSTEPQGLKISYKAGYVCLTAPSVGQTALPSDIKLAAIKQIGWEYNKQKAKSWGESSRSYPDGSQSFSESGDLLPEVMKVLDQYMNPYIG